MNLVLSDDLLRAIFVSLVAALVIRFVPGARQQKSLLAVSLGASAVIYGWTFGAILLVAVAVWIAAVASQRQSGGDSQLMWRTSVITLGFLVVFFLVGRDRLWQALPFRAGQISVAWFALDMWVTLRLATFLLESGSGAIRNFSFVRYLCWCFLPFCSVGPILRFSEFDEQLERLEQGDLPSAWGRESRSIALLSIAQLSLAVALANVQRAVGETPMPHLTMTLLNAFLFLPVGFYLLSAGYFHAMELLAGVAGFAIPPSFRNPFSARNISEFWARWNMTATSVFRDYLYYNRWGLTRHHQMLNITILFLLVGLWHSANAYWITWGAMHAGGFCVYLWFAHRRSLRPDHVAERHMPRPVAVGLTYLFVCSCWLLPPTLIRIVRTGFGL